MFKPLTHTPKFIDTIQNALGSAAGFEHEERVCCIVCAALSRTVSLFCQIGQVLLMHTHRYV